MLARLWAISLFLCGLGLLGVASWQYFGPDGGPGLIVDEPEREISGCTVGQTKTITFPFHNHARHSVQIVGLVDRPGQKCRFGTKREPPYDIPAGATDALDCTLEVRQVGTFENQLRVYVNDTGLRLIVLKVHGKAESAGTEAKQQ